VNLILLTSGPGGELTVHQVRHQIGTEPMLATRAINLLILDSRRMEPECFESACSKISVLKAHFGLHYGVLLCQTPTLPLTVAAIRCGLRDIIHQFIGAARLRSIVQAANPGVRVGVREFDAVAAFLRTFSGNNASDTPVADIARREQELARRAEELNKLEKRLYVEKDAVENRDREVKERTRRLDRQFAMMQKDTDIGSGTSGAAPSSAAAPAGGNNSELQALALRLEQRAAELDFREKLLLEMETALNTPAK
jgi:hypothetical protein